MPIERAYVYILANGFKRIYVGVTTRLPERLREHKSHLNPNSHTARYNITQLVYVERHLSFIDAIAREKQIKGWLRIKKLQLIISTNPTWRDLSPDILDPPTRPQPLSQAASEAQAATAVEVS